MIKAIIFDMDGTMIDSEILHFNAYNQALHCFGIEFNLEDYWKVWGSDKDICKGIIEKFNLDISWEELMESKSKIYRESFIYSLKPQKGLVKLLENLKKDAYLLAVASSSQIYEIKIILDSLKIAHFFREIASAESVENGKPSPDIYLLVAEKLGVLPENCLVLEDSPKGLLSAKKAGMKCFTLPTPYVKNGDFSLADKVLDSLEDVYYNLKNNLL